MKGVEAFVAYILIIAMSLAAIAIVFQAGNPAIEKNKEIQIFNDGKNNLRIIDNAVNDVVIQGEGSTRSLTISSSGGSYLIDEINDKIIFSMDSQQQVFGPNITKIEDGINITAQESMIIMTITYQNINITGVGSFGKGNFNVLVKYLETVNNKPSVLILPQ